MDDDYYTQECYPYENYAYGERFHKDEDWNKHHLNSDYSWEDKKFKIKSKQTSSKMDWTGEDADDIEHDFDEDYKEYYDEYYDYDGCYVSDFNEYSDYDEYYDDDYNDLYSDDEFDWYNLGYEYGDSDYDHRYD